MLKNKKGVSIAGLEWFIIGWAITAIGLGVIGGGGNQDGLHESCNFSGCFTVNGFEPNKMDLAK